MVLQASQPQKKDKTMGNMITAPISAATETVIKEVLTVENITAAKFSALSPEEMAALPKDVLKKADALLKEALAKTSKVLDFQKQSRKDNDLALRHTILNDLASLKSMPVVVKVEGEFVEVTLEEALFGHECTIMAQVKGQPEGTKAPRKFTAKLDSIRLAGIQKALARVNAQFKGEVTRHVKPTEAPMEEGIAPAPVAEIPAPAPVEAPAPKAKRTHKAKAVVA
jgi:hypothetical protein